MLRDLKLAVRMLVKSPAFTAVALLTLALGIGANAAIFTLVDAVLLRPLPVSHPEQLALLTGSGAEGLSMGTSSGPRQKLAYTEYQRLRAQDDAFTGLIAAGLEHPEALVNWARPGRATAPELARIQLVSNNYFAVLGVVPYRGRMFDDAAALKPGGDPVAVMRYGYWNQRFHRDPAVLGRTFTLHDTRFTVAGIAPPGFFGTMVGVEPDLWMPLAMQAQALPGRDLLHDAPGVGRFMWLQAIGRLKPGVTLAAAQAQSNAIFLQSVEEQAGEARGGAMRRALLDQSLQLSSGARGGSYARSQFAAPLTALLALVGMVLLLAVVNLASLLLARAAARRQEMGVRLALGAGRGRILRQVLTESVLLALAGGALGALLAWWGVHALVGMLSPGGALALPLAPDARVLGFVLAISVASGILFGLAPAWRMARTNLNATLQSQGRGVHRRLPLGKALIAGQVAISMILLAGAGLFLHSLLKLESQNVGFDPDHLVETDVNLARSGYNNATGAAFFHRFLDQAAALPGVSHVALSLIGIFDGNDAGIPVTVNGYTPPAGAATDQASDVELDAVSADFFQTVGIPILLGRALNRADATSAERHAVINATMANVFFHGRNPLGHRIHDAYPDDHGVTYTIVGVCGDIKAASLAEPPTPRFYLSYFNGLAAAPQWAGSVLIRERGGGAATGAAVRALLLGMQPGLRVENFDPVAKKISATVVNESLLAKLSGFFGALALLLAAIGLYGVLAYGVVQRTAELGVRLALGASRGAVIGLVLREMLVLLAIGLAIGIPASLALARLCVQRMDLFQVHAGDPAAFAGAALALALAALAAGFLPAWRASRVDPLHALRQP